MQIIKEIYLNLYDQPVVNVYAKQGDNGRYIKATILDNAIVYTIPADASARIASGGVWNNCTVSNNSVMACLTPDMLKPGQNLCQIELIQGNTKLTTVSFILSVEKSARNDIAIEGSTEFGTLDKAITDAQKVINEAETAEATRKTAETARASAESTRKSQETARVNAEAARVSAENTRKSQETARGTAESTRATAENTRKSQETARVNAEAARVTEFTTLKADSESATAKALAAAGGDISEKTVNYTESTAATAPASGSKLSAISGWLIGKVKNLVARMGTAETSITALNSNIAVKIYTNSYTSNGAIVTATVQGHCVGIKIRGSAAVQLGTGTATATLGVIKELIPLFSTSSEIIGRTVITNGIYGQLRIEASTGAVKIGYTTDASGTSCNIPAGANFYIDTSFVL